MQDQMPPSDMNSMPGHGPDREGAMAKADLYKLANYSLKLFKQMQDEDQLEGWVQAKITKAADYIASVYHYMEYEMKFSEYGHHLDNSDTLSEGQKQALKGKLMEAKEKMKELKKKQADKVAGKKEKEIEEGFEAGAKTGSTFKTKTGVATKTDKGVKHTNTSHSDEEHGEPASKVKARSAADKAGEKAQDKAAEKESKAWGKANPGKQAIYKDGKKVNEAAKPDYIDADDDGDEKEPMKKAFADKKKAPFKKVKEALKGGQKKLDADDDGDIEADDLADLRAKKEKKVDEASKPSAGMSKGAKSSLAKKASAGKDIGKPGKSFAKVADKAGGGEKGKKIAAAAMWKNAAKKETKTDENLVPVPNPSGAKDAEEAKKLGAMMPAKAGEKEAKTDENLQVVPNPSGAKDAEEAKKLGAMMPAKAGEKDPIRESAELTRMKEFLTRLNG